tara:strand:- start:18281 stop:21415 length:3135 start_codon:yes stop_codon:yes gene_type:complete
MSVRKFKFVSPGVFINEIDNSQLPNEPREVGPLIIGRAARGPALRPVTVGSYADFVNIFGEPIPGGKGDDVWRNGNTMSPTYGPYAAQAWLRNSTPLTFIRLLGSKNKDATSAGEAGWVLSNRLIAKSTPTLTTEPSSLGTSGSAYGLWVLPNEISSSKAFTSSFSITGSLAAVWYVEDGYAGLIGNANSSSATASTSDAFASGSNRLIFSDSNGYFTLSITGSNTDYPNRVIKFSLAENDSNYIRKVFNTNPTVINKTITPSGSRERYWLGETYANNFLMKKARGNPLNAYNEGPGTVRATQSGSSDHGTSAPSASAHDTTATYIGLILPLASASAADNFGTKQTPFEDGTVSGKESRNNARSGWVFGQTLEAIADKANYTYTGQQKLFKFVALDYGSWANKELKVSITNIDYSSDQFNKYGTFDVLVRDAGDTDTSPEVLERFSNCNLNPNSENYVAAKIGDEFVYFNATTRRLTTEGTFVNRSKLIRIEMDVGVDGAQTNEEYLPFGYFGPIKYDDINLNYLTNLSGGFDHALRAKLYLSGGASDGVWAPAEQSEGDTSPGMLSVFTGSGFGEETADTSAAWDASSMRLKLLFPAHELRMSSSQDDVPDYTNAYWGVWSGKSKTNPRYNTGYGDLNRPLDSAISSLYTPSATDKTEYQFVFTLDEIVQPDTDKNEFVWTSGSYVLGNSVSVQSSNDYKSILDKTINKFTVPLAGGADGLDVTEQNPFRNTGLTDGTANTNYAYNSIKEAVDMTRDTEFFEYNLLACPGITNENLTYHLIQTAESRADALAVIDLKGDFVPADEDNSGVTYPNLSQTITNLKDRAINSSYGCAYFPFVQVRDPSSSTLVYMPSSVVALGAMAYTDRVRAPWFAPAGFNRGGLSSGIAGLPVVNVTKKLTAQDRDDLYKANINPIASFPNEGIVIFGQKTLQVTRSALDRINVRRLMLFVKKGISQIASTMLFEPNVRQTWARFIGQAEPFLADVKARFGLDDYKLILDETTTTPDLIDRNVLYAKVFLKPTRAIEFVAIDFVISNTGAAFED